MLCQQTAPRKEKRGRFPCGFWVQFEGRILIYEFCSEFIYFNILSLLIMVSRIKMCFFRRGEREREQLGTWRGAWRN